MSVDMVIILAYTDKLQVMLIYYYVWTRSVLISRR